MKKSHLIGALNAVVFACISMSSHATLTYVLGGQAVYDSDADLTWLTNANAAGTDMDWATANAWAAGLTVGGVTGWRLPDTLQPDSSCGFQTPATSDGYSCTGSEMGNLFYSVLGGVAGALLTTTHNTNYDLFSNVQSYFYWSSTEYAPDPADAWFFNFIYGTQYTTTKYDSLYAWAV